MGCDEYRSSSATGTLAVSIQVGNTTVASGFAINFVGDIRGDATSNVWDFGDGGAVVSNKLYLSHSWDSPGTYQVELKTFNLTYPEGVAATVLVHIVEQPVHFVIEGHANAQFPYISWGTAASNIQDGIDASSVVGALVLVSNGIYETGGVVVHDALTNRVAVTKPVTVRSVNGPNETFIVGRGPLTNFAVRCVYVGPDAVLDGFTLTNGHTRRISVSLLDSGGGGAWCEASAMLTNCVVVSNAATRAGGGVFGGTLNNCTLIRNLSFNVGGGAAGGTQNGCILSNNWATQNGGGAYDSTLNNCTVATNFASRSGGGAYDCKLNSCKLIYNRGDFGGGANLSTLNNCTVTENRADVGGGAYRSMLNNCMVTSNRVSQRGGGAYDSELKNCTLVGNFASVNTPSADGGGGVFGSILHNSIVYANKARIGPNYTSSSEFHYSCTTPLPTNNISANNIDKPPQFADPGSADYRLGAASPCIDAGRNEFVPSQPFDVAGEPRVRGASVDMGAHEFFFEGQFRLLLEGAYQASTDRMSSHLFQQGQLPLTSPYAADRRNVDKIPSNVTDWVLFEVREETDSPARLTRSLFLREDGQVIRDDGSEIIDMVLDPLRDYRVFIKHRNHMGAMSSEGIAFTNRNIAYDFTTSSAQYVGGTDVAIELEPGLGLWGSRAGDVDGSGNVDTNIDQLVYNGQAGATGYQRADVNLDGIVDGNDLALVQTRHNTASPVPRPEVSLAPSGRITPPRQTLVEGESLQLMASGFTGSISWAFAEANSGGSLNTDVGDIVIYTADGTPGEFDTVQAWDPSNRLAQTFLNVIGSDESTSLGKAVIIAGGLDEKDPVWVATEYLGDKAYTTLRYRGFARDHVQYLSFGPQHDVDGDGMSNDITYAHAITEDVAETFTNWVGNADRLMLYMVDHGADPNGTGQFRLNGEQFIAASTMDQWLDELQNMHTDLHITVILDFCYAGSYLDELDYDGDPERRIVISSTANDELTYFIAEGRISFSEFFFNGVLQGLSVFDSYELARGAMETYQQAWIDDTQDGVYGPIVGCELGVDCGPEVDGVFATTNYIGASFIAGKDFPVIGSVLENQVLTSGSRATLWADDIASFYALDRVWCTIVPPGFLTDTDTGVPVVNITTRDLTNNPATGRYEIEFDGFITPGTYIINFYAKDIWESVSPNKQTAVVQAGFLEKVVLVAGGDVSDENWSAVLGTARLAHETFRSRLIAPSNIYFVSASSFEDFTNDGTNDVSSGVSMAAVQNAVQGWANDADRLTVYLIGGHTNVNNEYRVSLTETISSEQLDSWLDSFQISNRTANVLLEFPGSGKFISSLKPPTDKDRYVVASSAADREQVLTEQQSFSTFLLSEISKGESLGLATRRARKTIRSASGNLRQKAMIDDSNNGIANEKNIDGTNSLSRYIGSPFFTGEDIPNIADVTLDQVLTNETSVLLWAGGISDADGISNVWVEITSPTNFSGAVSTRLDLTNNVAEARWEKNYDGFSQPGIYIFTFYAMDTLSNTSAEVQTQIIKTDTNNYELILDEEHPDVFEPDDTFSDASYSDLSLIQVHTLHESNDCDVVRFFAVSNLVYDIETIHLGTNPTIDTVIEIYREEVSSFDDPSAKPVLLEAYTVDEFGREEGELTGLDCPETGFYYVKVCQAQDAEFSSGSYLLTIHIPAGRQGITVHVWDVLARERLSGALVDVVGHASVPSDSGGPVRFPDLDQGNYTVQVTVPHAGSHGPSYIPLFSPSSSEDVASNRTSDYGNPRQIGTHEFGTISYSGLELVQKRFSVLSFGFIPVAYVEAQLRDAITGEPVAGMELQVTASGSNEVFTKRPWADYGVRMTSEVDGRFGTNAPILPTKRYTKYQISDDVGAYEANVSPTNVTSPVAGEKLDLGVIWLESKFCVESNNIPVRCNDIPNSWELKYGFNYGELGLPNDEDSDEDGLSNLQEYFADTHPMDPNQVFRVDRLSEEVHEAFTVGWDAAPHRIYEIDRNTELVEEGGWIKVHEVTNTLNEATLSWTDVESMNETNGIYRINVKDIAKPQRTIR